MAKLFLLFALGCTPEPAPAPDAATCERAPEHDAVCQQIDPRTIAFHCLLTEPAGYLCWTDPAGVLCCRH